MAVPAVCDAGVTAVRLSPLAGRGRNSSVLEFRVRGNLRGSHCHRPRGDSPSPRPSPRKRGEGEEPLRPGHASYPLAAPTFAKRRRMRINSWSQTSR
ncbi:hypothetical protein D6B98_28465 [Bradyrhizobium sp. LVM 105]|nr:hypothetical protein D6B98_28465 [Bradyrhizobium sp. LVM 105]